MGYIYLVTNRLTGKQYIGQTLHIDIETRWNQHRRVCETMLGRHLLSAYKKYGIHNFKFQVVCVCFDEACNDLESFYIKKFNTLAPNGYNLKEGGRNSKHSEETKQLMSQNRKGKGLGYMTEEILQSRIGRFAGEKNPNFGKKLTEEEKRQRSESMKRVWKEKKALGIGAHENTVKALQEANARRWESFREKNPKPVSKGRKQRVAKLDEYGNILEEFESIAEASQSVCIDSSKISAVCRGTRVYAKGFRWKYLDISINTFERNKTTGEKYITAYKNGYMLRISRKDYKVREWFHSLEDAIDKRDLCMIELGE